MGQGGHPCARRAPPSSDVTSALRNPLPPAVAGHQPDRWRHRQGARHGAPHSTRAAHQPPGPLTCGVRYPPDGAIGGVARGVARPQAGGSATASRGKRDRKPGEARPQAGGSATESRERRTRMRGRSEPGPQDRLVKVPVPLPLRTSAPCRVTRCPRIRELFVTLETAAPARQHSLWITLWTAWGVTGVLLGKSVARACGYLSAQLLTDGLNCPNVIHPLWRKDFSWWISRSPACRTHPTR